MRVVLALLALAAASTAAPSIPTSFSLPLYKRQLSPNEQLSPELRLLQFIEQHRRTRGKYGHLPADEEGVLAKRSAATGSESLAGNDLSYYTSIAVGTPPRIFEVVMDTGSADLVMATSASNTCGSICVTTAPLYSVAKSSSAVASTQSISITYGTGSAKGVLVQDQMSLAGFTAQQTIAACNSISDLTTSSDQSGLMGLGWSALSASKSTPFVQGLWQSGQLQSPQFGFGLAPLDPTDVNPQSVVSGGIMTIGGVNNTLFTGPLNYVNIVSQTYWAVPLDNIAVQGYVLGISASNAVIDTGTNGITIPSSAAAAVYAKIPGSSQIPNSGGLYQYPCSTSVSFALTFGGILYPMVPKDFNLGATDSSGILCVGAVGAMAGSASSGSSNSTFIVGTPFLMSFYTAYRFSPASVGFAPMADPNSVLENVAIPSSGSSNVGGLEVLAASSVTFAPASATTSVVVNPRLSTMSTATTRLGTSSSVSEASATPRTITSGAQRKVAGGLGVGLAGLAVAWAL